MYVCIRITYSTLDGSIYMELREVKLHSEIAKSLQRCSVSRAAQYWLNSN